MIRQGTEVTFFLNTVDKWLTGKALEDTDPVQAKLVAVQFKDPATGFLVHDHFPIRACRFPYPEHPEPSTQQLPPLDLPDYAHRLTSNLPPEEQDWSNGAPKKMIKCGSCGAVNEVR